MNFKKTIITITSVIALSIGVSAFAETAGTNPNPKPVVTHDSSDINKTPKTNSVKPVKPVVSQDSSDSKKAPTKTPVRKPRHRITKKMSTTPTTDPKAAPKPATN